MTDKTPTQRIIEDLELRGVTLAGVIAITKDKQLKVITYDGLGLVDSITQGDNAIALYGKASVDTSAMRELFTLSVPAGRPEKEE